MKYQTFITELTNQVSKLDRDTVKLFLGDSTDNNRTLTVNQVIRFLTQQDSNKLIRLGSNLRRVYSVVRPRINDSRYNAFSGRTDAFDIQEFLTVYNDEIEFGGLNRVVGHLIK